MLPLRSTQKVRNQRNHKQKPETPSRLKALLSHERVNSVAGAVSSGISSVDWGLFRIKLVAFFFVCIWLALWGRAWYLQMIEGPYLAQRARRQHVAVELVSGKRGEILDRNGQVMARSVESLSVYARPHQITDAVRVANTLAPLLGQDAQSLFNRISVSTRKFIWLERKVDDKTAKAVRDADLAGIGLSKEYTRIYPFKSMAGQLLGFVGMDDKGMEGLEHSLDDVLTPTPTRQEIQRDAMGRRFFIHSEEMGDPSGNDVQLTLDVQIQFFAEEAIAKTVQEYKADWGGVMVVEVATGDIVAWAQYPFFNPNDYNKFRPTQYRNRMALDALEPGSTFKPFLMAAAIQEKKINKDTLINCEGGRWKTKDVTIRDTSRHDILPANKVLRYSSNIGMAKIGLMMGSTLSHRYLYDLGFGQATAVPVTQSRGLLRAARDWREADLMSTWFGQSISVTGVQMAQAYLTMLNNGVVKPLRLLKDDALTARATSLPENIGKRVFSADVCRQLMSMMRDVVEEDGSGRRARVEGVEVGGKTGTAQKADKRTRRYGDKRLSSFVGFLPANKPSYLILAMVDEPSINAYGGIVAAPAFQAVATNVMTYSGQLAEHSIKNAAEKEERAAEKEEKAQRGPKLVLAPDKHVFTENLEDRRVEKGLRAPGHLAKASTSVPNVVGKSVRSAVELFARGGVVPVIRGEGQRVVRQSPDAGSPWPEGKAKGEWVLWLSDK